MSDDGDDVRSEMHIENKRLRTLLERETERRRDAERARDQLAQRVEGLLQQRRDRMQEQPLRTHSAEFTSDTLATFRCVHRFGTATVIAELYHFDGRAVDTEKWSFRAESRDAVIVWLDEPPMNGVRLVLHAA